MALTLLRYQGKTAIMLEAEKPTWARSEGVITPPCHGGDRRFKSGRARHEKRVTFW
jgi:hypothetical protein